MDKKTGFMVNVLFTVVLCLVSLSCSSWAGVLDPADGTSAPVTDQAASPAIPPNVSLEFRDFPDLPTPMELKRVDSESSILKISGYTAGHLILRGRVEEASLVDFFSKTMPSYGWEFKGSLAARTSILAFSKGSNAQCMIRIKPQRFGLSTEVEIWIVSLGGGGTW